MLRKILPALSAALVYASAYADTGVFNVNFQTPSGNIICGGDTAHSKRETAWHGVSCFIQDTGYRQCQTRPAETQNMRIRLGQRIQCRQQREGLHELLQRLSVQPEPFRPRLRKQHQRQRLAVRQPRKRHPLHQLGRTRIPAQPQPTAYVLKQMPSVKDFRRHLL